MKKGKIVLAFTCAFCFLMNSIVFAAETPQNSKVEMLTEICSEATVYDQQHEENLCALMDMYGFTAEEQAMLLQIERERMSVGNSASLYSFPSNPEIGDVHKETYKIGINTLIAGGATAASIAAKLMGILGVPLSSAIAIASAIATDYANDHNINGVIVTVSYTYGPTNDGPLGWTPGYTSYTTY